MNKISKILKFELRNLIQSKWIIFYTIFFAAISYSLFLFSSDPGKAFISLMNIVLIVIPLVSLVFGAVYIYNSREFIETVLTQPVKRPVLFFGIYLGLAGSLSAAFVVGILIPYLLIAFRSTAFSDLFLTLAIGIALTFIFTAIASLVVVLQDDKAKGLGLLIFIWLFTAIIYDGLVFFILQYFEEYPLEKVMIGMSLINPLDLARMIFLMKFNIAALMGYTGAVFQKFFGSSFGILLASFFMLLWIFIPFFFASRSFSKKDF